MSLRSKLALGLGGLALLALALGVAGVVLLGRLGPAIDVVLYENQRSVLAMQRAKEGLERQDSGALFALLGRPDQTRQLVEAYDPVVRQAIALEQSNITIEGEQERAPTGSKRPTTPTVRPTAASWTPPPPTPTASGSTSGRCCPRSRRPRPRPTRSWP